METLTQKDMCTFMFIAAAFTTAKISKCLLIDEWIKKLCVCVSVFVHTMEYYLVCQRIWHLAVCDNMDGCSIWWNKSDDDKYHMISLICEIWKEEKQNWETQRTDWWLPEMGMGWEKCVKGVGT